MRRDMLTGPSCNICQFCSNSPFYSYYVFRSDSQIVVTAVGVDRHAMVGRRLRMAVMENCGGGRC
jgi:hypothetical protein